MSKPQEDKFEFGQHFFEYESETQSSSFDKDNFVIPAKLLLSDFERDILEEVSNWAYQNNLVHLTSEEQIKRYWELKLS